MKTFFEKIPLDTSKTYIIREFKVDELTYPLHYHPYYEINWFITGNGERFIGQNITKFSNRDLTLIGPDLPHQFKSKNSYKNKNSKFHVIVLQFHPYVFGNEFISREEMVVLQAFLERAKRGLVFGNEVKKKAGILLQKLLIENGFKGIVYFIQLLELLCNTKRFQYLSDFAWNQLPSENEKGRTNQIFRYIFERYTDNIKLSELAEIAGISNSAFSHYFRKKTGKTFSTFLNELRISHATRLLRETDKKVIEICFESGFNNMAYFNRVFKQTHKINPREYRKRLAG